METKKKNLLLILAIFSLVAIATIILVGVFLKKTNNKEAEPRASVLGEIAEKTEPSPTSFVNSLVQNTLNNTSGFLQNSKETMSDKITTIEKTILQTVQNEINTLTKSQIKNLQTQICTDWGIVSPPVSP